MRNFLLLLCLLWTASLMSQDVWTLEQCIGYANANNLSLKQTGLQINIADINLKEAKQSRFPSLNSNINGGISFGRTIDPTSNSFSTESFSYGNYGLSSGIAVYQGGQINNSIRKSKVDQYVSAKVFQQAANDLALLIASDYLNVLLSIDRLEVSVKSKENVQQQLDQVEKMVKAGLRPEADLYEVKAQLAKADELRVISENALDLAWLQLKQSMMMDHSKKIQLAPLSEQELQSIQTELYSYEELVATSAATHPGLEAAKLRLESAKWSEKIARGLFYPSVFVSGTIGSRFSDAARIPTTFTESRQSIPGIFIDDVAVKYEVTQYIPNNSELISFADQYDQNLNYGFGASISIPIYNNYRNKASVQRAKINTLMMENQYGIERETLAQQIAQSIAAVKAAIKEYDSALLTEQSSKEALSRIQKRFDIGSGNSMELSLAQNQFQSATINTVIARYNLFFKQKVLDFYAGKKIK